MDFDGASNYFSGKKILTHFFSMLSVSSVVTFLTSYYLCRHILRICIRTVCIHYLINLKVDPIMIPAIIYDIEI
jgi:hypothetical protein